MGYEMKGFPMIAGASPAKLGRLKKLKEVIKKLFKGYYTSRKFEPPDDLEGAGAIWLAGAMASIKGAFSVKAFLPWYRRGSLRTNPYNANDELCKKKD